MRNFPKQTFAGALVAALSSVAFAQPPSIPPSPSWTRALPPGPDTRVKITEEYAMHIARDAYFWGWPLVNVYNKRLAAARSTQLAYAGPVPSAPLNRLVMVTTMLPRANALLLIGYYYNRTRSFDSRHVRKLSSRF